MLLIQASNADKQQTSPLFGILAGTVTFVMDFDPVESTGENWNMERADPTSRAT